MSENLAEAVSEYTTSYIVDTDIIARMSIEGFEELRDRVLEMIYRIKVPKHRVGKHGNEHDTSTAEGLAKSIQDTLYDEGETKNSEFKAQVEAFWRFQAELKEKTKNNDVRLCLPGSIVQLFRTLSNASSRHQNQNQKIRSATLVTGSDRRLTRRGESLDSMDSSLGDVDKYTARWATRSDFNNILISSHLLSDHDPIGVKKKIQTVAKEQFGLNSSFALPVPEHV
jgi:hypothetical protein